MNKVILMGRLTKDPEVRYSTGNEPLAVARFTLAVNKNRRKKEGEPDADFIGCVAFGKQGEFVEKYLKKGQMVSVVGRLNVYSYDDQAGQKKWVTDVVVEETHFAESKASFESRTQTEYQRPSEQSRPSSPQSGSDGFYPVDEAADDDLPF